MEVRAWPWPYEIAKEAELPPNNEFMKNRREPPAHRDRSLCAVV